MLFKCLNTQSRPGKASIGLILIIEKLYIILGNVVIFGDIFLINAGVNNFNYPRM